MNPRRLQRLTRVSRTSGGIALVKCVGRSVLLPQFRYMTVNIQRLPGALWRQLTGKKSRSRIFKDKQPDFHGKSANQLIRAHPP